MIMRSRPPIIRDKVHAALASCTDPLGATHVWIRETADLNRKAVTMALLTMKSAGLVFALGRNRHARYFASEAARNAAAPAVDAYNKAAAEKMRRERYRRGDARRKASPEAMAKRKAYELRKAVARKAMLAEIRAAKPPKPPKPMRPPKTNIEKIRAQKPHAVQLVIKQPKAVNLEKLAKKRWNEQEAIRPAGVKVQKLPGFSERSRFEPPKCFRGEFVAEWRAKRSA